MGLSNQVGLNELSVPELVKLGHEARKLKDYGRALELFELALQKNPSNTNLSVEVARSLVDQGDVEAGRQILLSLEHLKQFQIYALLGRIERLRVNRESALHYYSLALALKPDHPTLPAEIATELRVLERLDEAEQILLSLSERLPSSSHALNGLAQIARAHGDRKKALSYYRALEVLDSSHPNVHIDIAIELRELGRLEEAAQSLDMSCNPNPGLIWHQKGLIANAQENHDLAIECFKNGIEQQRDHIVCHQALIAKFFQLGSFDEVRRGLDIALQIFPNHTELRRFEYRNMRAIGKVGKAIELVQALHTTEPKHLNILYDFVEYLCFLGQFEHALKLMESCENCTHNDRFLFLKSRHAMSQFKVDEAIDIVDQAISINPKNVHYQQHRISLNIMAGNISGAQDDIKSLKVKFQNKGWGNKQLKSVGGIPAEILREIKLNPYANRRLSDSKQLCREDELRSVAKIVKDEPNHLGSAIRLLVLMSQDRKLYQCLKVLDENVMSKIPKIIAQFWDKNKSVPAGIERTMQSWIDMNPDFNYQCFDDQSAQEFIQTYHSPNVLKAFRMANHPAMRADLFRIAYLYQCGGLYADADDLCIKPISEFISDGPDLLLVQGHAGTIRNHFLATSPRHPFIGFALACIVNNILDKAGGIWFASGPGVLTISFCQMYADFFERGQMPLGVEIKESHSLHKYVTPHLHMSYKTSSLGWNSPRWSSN